MQQKNSTRTLRKNVLGQPLPKVKESSNASEMTKSVLSMEEAILFILCIYFYLFFYLTFTFFNLQ